jgi:hypothetical protein
MERGKEKEIGERRKEPHTKVGIRTELSEIVNSDTGRQPDRPTVRSDFAAVLTFLRHLLDRP